ncbi:hypothetical protein NC651_036531 [Populus alba x Populus x berolinensis]|nr:hypothetical protein NC651_036531 [Populus alba x Populus x berolinensis]
MYNVKCSSSWFENLSPLPKPLGSWAHGVKLAGPWQAQALASIGAKSSLNSFRMEDVICPDAVCSSWFEPLISHFGGPNSLLQQLILLGLLTQRLLPSHEPILFSDELIASHRRELRNPTMLGQVTLFLLRQLSRQLKFSRPAVEKRFPLTVEC